MTPGAPIRSFRIPADLYDAVREMAADRDETLTSIVIDAFNRYLKKK